MRAQFRNFYAVIHLIKTTGRTPIAILFARMGIISNELVLRRRLKAHWFWSCANMTVHYEVTFLVKKNVQIFQNQNALKKYL